MHVSMYYTSAVQCCDRHKAIMCLDDDSSTPCHMDGEAIPECSALMEAYGTEHCVDFPALDNDVHAFGAIVLELLLVIPVGLILLKVFRWAAAGRVAKSSWRKPMSRFEAFVSLITASWGRYLGSGSRYKISDDEHSRRAAVFGDRRNRQLTVAYCLTAVLLLGLSVLIVAYSALLFENISGDADARISTLYVCIVLIYLAVGQALPLFVKGLDAGAEYVRNGFAPTYDVGRWEENRLDELGLKNVDADLAEGMQRLVSDAEETLSS
eukprot:Rmarinus@m.6698